ncbi:MAG: polyphosphate kinase 2 family protein [Planctomycetes bacterium]|nr:polyphosphate kinase 2 family protein [Planctomycetota bacterium]
MNLDTDRHRVLPGIVPDLDAIPADDTGGLEKSAARKELRRLLARLDELQVMMYAQGKHSLLVVLQAMDAGGKDSTIRAVFGPLNPQGVQVTGFKAPSSLELKHDYLWRVHDQCPPRGTIRVFNRSHYEDVLVVRVKSLVPEERWRRRYEQINDFERLVHDEGTTIVKLYLHITKDYQLERFRRRLARPDKHWKFNPNDLVERARWGDYRSAFEEALGRCSKMHAPWYVIPAERRWYRNLLVTRILVDTLEGLNMSYPKPDFDVEQIVLE